VLDATRMRVAVALANPIQIPVVNLHRLAFSRPLPTREGVLVIGGFRGEGDRRALLGTLRGGGGRGDLEDPPLQLWVRLFQDVDDLYVQPANLPARRVDGAAQGGERKGQRCVCFHGLNVQILGTSNLARP
jgi:hypothetical protein